MPTEDTIFVEDFEAAALPHLCSLYRSALRVLYDPAQAEDVVQETYLQAWKSFHRYQSGTNCKAWLFKILFHVIQHHRRKWFSWRLESREEVVEDTLVYEPPIPEQIADEDMLAALEKVPNIFREALLLADVQEFSFREISEILGIPIGTVMSRVSRGRKSLRTHLAACHESPRAGMNTLLRAPSGQPTFNG